MNLIIFIYRIHLKRAKTWGYLINGSYNGIIGEMINGTVDISATPFMYSIERLDVVGFTVQVYLAELKIKHAYKFTFIQFLI